MGFNALSEIISDIWTWTDVNKDWMTIVIAIVAALATASAAIAAWCAARNTRLVAEGKLFFELIREYSTNRMLKDLQIIFDWSRKHNYSDEFYDKNEENKEMEEAAKQYANALYPSDGKQVDKYKDRLNKARRHVTHYFLNISDLVEGKYVDNSFAERICFAVGTDVLKRNLYLENALIDKLGELDKRQKNEIDSSKENIKRAFDQLITLSKRTWARGCRLSNKEA